MNETGRARKGKRTQIAGQFAWRLVEMMESPAYRALSLSAHRILARLEIEHAHHGGEDNGKLPCTFDHFAEYGIHRHAIAPAIRETVALGFVEVTEAGRAGNAAWRRPTLFRLTYRHTKLTEPTDEWRKISTVPEAEAIADQARKTKHQCRKPHHNSVRKPHHNGEIYGAETITTVHSAETITTSISRGQSLKGNGRDGSAEQAVALDTAAMR
ncbi:hypothetical protein [Manganibacter manganicus]|nr:hypothetical protein [Pseudaminobacter manganicus]